MCFPAEHRRQPKTTQGHGVPEKFGPSKACQCQQEQSEDRGGIRAALLRLVNRLPQRSQFLDRESSPPAGLLVALDVAAGIEMRRHELEPIGVAKDR